MVFKLALRNLVHDRTRLAVTLAGILFAVVLLAVQLGLYLGARQMIVQMVDRSKGDIWISGFNAESFEQAPLLSGKERFTALSVPGVETVKPLIATFADWKRPQGGSANVVLIGSDPDDGPLAPWNVQEGSAPELASDGVFVDKTYLSALGVDGIGGIAEMERQRVRVTGLTNGIRSFTTSPYIFASLNVARKYLGASVDQATFFLVSVKPGADVEATRAELAKRLPNTSVWTKDEFRQRNLDYWMFGTGAGVALLGGAALGLLVGTVIVAQTLYSSTKDHIGEFATLRALGSSSVYIHKVILTQAGLSAIFGYLFGMAVSLAIVMFSVQTALPILITPALAAILCVLTVVMCAVSAISSIVKVTKLDPAMVFSR
jgi:putative ABC transport system permease protein